MNDGIELLLERMSTHPEEFYGENSRWSYLVHTYEKFFTEKEKSTMEQAIHELRRKEFTQRVMEKLLEEEPMPVEIDSESYTFNSVGRAKWGTTTLSIQEAVLQQQEEKMRQAIQDEMNRLKKLEFAEQTKQQKNKSKMQQLLTNVTKRRQVY